MPAAVAPASARPAATTSAPAPTAARNAGRRRRGRGYDSPMRRLAHHLFTLCSAISLLLCIAVCVLWFDSYVSGEHSIALSYDPEYPKYPDTSLSLDRGTVGLGYYRKIRESD